MVKCQYCGKSVTKTSLSSHRNTNSCLLHRRGIYMCQGCGFQTKLYHDFIEHLDTCDQENNVKVCSTADLEHERIRSAVYKQIIESVLNTSIDAVIDISSNHGYLKQFLPKVKIIEPVDIEESAETDNETDTELEDEKEVEPEDEQEETEKETEKVPTEIHHMKQEKNLSFSVRRDSILNLLQKFKQGVKQTDSGEDIPYVIGQELTSLTDIGIQVYSSYEMYRQTQSISNSINESGVIDQSVYTLIDSITDSSEQSHVKDYTKVLFDLIQYQSDQIDLDGVKNDMGKSVYLNITDPTLCIDDICSFFTPMYAMFPIELFVEHWLCNRLKPMTVYAPPKKKTEIGVHFYIRTGDAIMKMDPYLTVLSKKLSTYILKSCGQVFRPVYKATHRNNLMGKSVDLFRGDLLTQIGPQIYENAQIASCEFTLRETLRNAIIKHSRDVYTGDCKLISSAYNPDTFALETSRASVGIPPMGIYCTEWFDCLFDGLGPNIQQKLISDEYLRFIQKRFNRVYNIEPKFRKQIETEKKSYLLDEE